VRIEEIISETQAKFSQPISYIVARHHQEGARRILRSVLTLPNKRLSGFAERLSAATMNPLTGIPLFFLALFLLYEFVGVLGAQTLVDLLEEAVFGEHINPWVNQVLAAYVPWPVVRNLFGGQYGIITLGVRYAVAIILPIVGTFFIAFSIIEDSGYLPRLAMLIDRVFKKIGLNGRAVIPMVLGFGCDTMATIVTRTLESRRERILSTLLLALAIPCSAQLGVMLGLLAGRPDLLWLWVIIVTGVFLLVGFLAAKVIPGERPTFYMELPPLRLPKLTNVLVKTYTRMEWYFREVFPVFILASLFIWLGQLTGLFDLVVNALVPLVRWIGLPDETAVAFLFGFFRRDYGAAGLYDLREVMTGAQLLVSTTTLTLFVPCIAQFSVTLKERGWKTALAITAFIFPFAFLVGGLLNRILEFFKVTL
jgi:ferrous iron transport protein B